jgi:hypothetical protein
MLRRFALEIPIVLLTATLAACASVPPRTSPPVKAKAEAPRIIDLLCHRGARSVRFDKIGVPEGEQPIDVALSRESIWVLFRGGRLMHLGRREADHLDVRMFFLLADEGWEEMDVDPLDDSLWVVSLSSLDLYHVSSDGKVSTVKLQSRTEGQGGFVGLRVGRDAIYALPACADSALWRLDRSGKLLGTAFKTPEKALVENRPRVMDSLQNPDLSCYSVRLEKDFAGRIHAWESGKEQAWQVDAEGNWEASDSLLFAYLPKPGGVVSLKGVNIGERSEQWFLAGVRGDVFFWKGQPIFLGTFATRERSIGDDTVLYVPGENGLREMIMPCNGYGILDADSDANGYAAITHRFLVLGDMASAPDLP